MLTRSTKVVNMTKAQRVSESRRKPVKSHSICYCKL